MMSNTPVGSGGGVGLLAYLFIAVEVNIGVIAALFAVSGSANVGLSHLKAREAVVEVRA